MKKRALCLLIDGFEEIEAVTPIDLMRRAGIEVVTASLSGTLLARGRSGILIHADQILDESIRAEDFDLLLIPGGPGVTGMRRDERASAMARAFADQGKILAAICAAPVILQDAGLLNGNQFTAHSSTRDALPDAIDERVVIDPPLITSRGAGTSLDFALAIISTLLGQEAADQVASSIMA